MAPIMLVLLLGLALGAEVPVAPEAAIAPDAGVVSIEVADAGVVTAEAPSAPAKTPYELKWDPRIDLPVTGVLMAAWLTTEFTKSSLAPDACRWCVTNGFDNAIRSLFNPSLEPSASGIKGPATASDITGFMVLPISMLGLDAVLAWREGTLLKTMPIDIVLVAEATFGALALTQLTKFLVGRARPYSIGATPELLAQGKDPADANLSFFSGHTSFAFAISTATATVLTLRGYKYAWLAWAIGMPLAATTAILRLAADKHWASDVLVGMVIGSAVGVGVPLLFHGRVTQSVSLRVMPMPNGVAFSGTF
jgi:membrane-associated phospholipid phosphatase